MAERSKTAGPPGPGTLRMWGGLLRHFRTKTELTQEALGTRTGYSRSVIVRIENGTYLPAPWFAAGADEHLGADGALIGAAPHLYGDDAPAPGPVDIAEEERRARQLWTYDTHVLHPLLQTPAYTHVVLLARRPPLTDAGIESRIRAGAERRARLLAPEPECTYSFVIEEQILHRPTGGPLTTRSQLRHLLDLAGRRHVTLQVLPASLPAHPGLSGTTTTLIGAPEGIWAAHLPFHRTHYLIHDPNHINALQARHLQLRAIALTPADTRTLLLDLIGQDAQDGTHAASPEATRLRGASRVQKPAATALHGQPLNRLPQAEPAPASPAARDRGPAGEPPPSPHPDPGPGPAKENRDARPRPRIIPAIKKREVHVTRGKPSPTVRAVLAHARRLEKQGETMPSAGWIKPPISSAGRHFYAQIRKEPEVHKRRRRG